MPDPIQILAIDPGEKVGWAHGEVVGSTLCVIDHGIATLKHLAVALAGRPAPVAVAALDQYDIVIYEQWRLAAYAAKALIGSDMQTSQLIGMIRLLGWLHDVKLVSQAPGDMEIGERCAPPTVTAILGTLPKSHDESHDGSALKHLAAYWYRHYFDPTTEA